LRSATHTQLPLRTAQHASADGGGRPGTDLAPVKLDPAQTVRPAQTDVAQGDAELASELIASGVTMQSVDTVIAVLSSHRDGATINAAAQAAGINYRTAQRIVEGADEHRQGQLAVVS
jgi:hypothetical protein